MNIIFCFIAIVSLDTEKPNPNRADASPFKLTEELRLGPEDGDQFLWNGPGVAVDADKDGNMYVVDDSEERIMVYNEKGEFLRQIGSPGEGPGEFTGLRSFQILANGEAIAFENLQSSGYISFYDKDKNFVKEIRFPIEGSTLDSITASPDGKLYYLSMTRSNAESGTRRFRDVIASSDWKELIEIQTNEQHTFNPARLEEPAYWSEILGERIGTFVQGKKGYAAFGPNGIVYTAKGSSYEIMQWDNKMNQKRTLTRKYKPIPTTEAEINAIADPIFAAVQSQLPASLQHMITTNVIDGALKKANFPPAKVPISGIWTTEAGNLVVLHDRSEATGRDTVDLFNPDGKYLGSYSHNNEALRLMVMKNGKAYAIETVDEENYLVRFKVDSF